MRAAVFTETGGPLSIENLEPSPPGPRDVIVQLGASGVCHSDLSLKNGYVAGIMPGTILGHEGAGTVAEVGKEVTKVKAGDHIVAAFIPACGTCWFCLHDQSHLCDNEFNVMLAMRGNRADAKVQELTGGRGVDYAFEVIGLPATLLQAYGMIRKGGTAILVGMTRGDAEVTLPTFDMFFNEKTVKGCKYGSGQVRRDFQRYADLIETGRLDTSSMVTRTIGLDDVNEGFRAMEAGEVIRSVITSF